MPPKGFRYILYLIGRKIFKKRDVTEVEYGQTLSKKRRRNCVLKSVCSLPDKISLEKTDWVDTPYNINFEFSDDLSLDLRQFDTCSLKNCSEKCFCATDSKSVSSDSACDMTSGSSCGDLPSARSSRSVEDFIRIHHENFPRQEPDCDYDILLSKSNCNVLEPSYENLKLVENFYETPQCIAPRMESVKKCSNDCAIRKIKDLVQSNKTYDEVIESLKVLHFDSGKTAADCERVAAGRENDINNYLENFKFYETNVNKDVESVSFQY